MDTNKEPLPSQLHALLTINDREIEQIEAMLSRIDTDDMEGSELVDRMVRLTILLNHAKELKGLIEQPATTLAEQEARQVHRIELHFMMKAMRKIMQ